jgi:O-antigen ligase
VADAHSLYVETAGELGLIGLVALGMLIAGIVISASRCMRADPALAAGALAAFVAWAVHAGLDWLWEMPAVSLVALALAALLVAQAEAVPRQPRP